MAEAEGVAQETSAPNQGRRGDTPTEATQRGEGGRVRDAAQVDSQVGDVALAGAPEAAGGEGAGHGEGLVTACASLGVARVATDEDLVYLNPQVATSTRGAIPIDFIAEESSFSDQEYDGEDEDSDGGSDLQERSGTGSEGLAQYGDPDIIRMQAILADLPKHGLYSPEARTCRCACVGGKQPLPGARPVFGESPGRPAAAAATDAELGAFTSADVVQAALLEAAASYPDFRGALGRLVVEQADADMAIFADHTAQRIYVSIRGTDPLSVRDISNDALVLLGFGPARVRAVEEAYREVKQRHPGYAAYGCGHSLGGTIMHHLACKMSREEALAFRRVDVFNAGGSPMRMSRSRSLPWTRYYSHRVRGDLVSLFYRPPASHRKSVEIQHPGKPDLAPHRLGHFLPPRAPSRRNTPLDLILDKFAMLFSCAASRKRELADAP